MTDNQLKTGCLVEVTAFKGEVLKRRVVEISDSTVYVCREDEWQAATEQKREPESVGFNRRFLIRVVGD